MKRTALEEEILEDISRLKEEWGIKEPLRLSGGFYQNYCNLSVSNRKIRKKKRQTWAGVLVDELGQVPKWKGVDGGLQSDRGIASQEVH